MMQLRTFTWLQRKSKIASLHLEDRSEPNIKIVEVAVVSLYGNEITISTYKILSSAVRVDEVNFESIKSNRMYFSIN